MCCFEYSNIENWSNIIPNCFVVEIKIHNFEMKFSSAKKSGREETEEA